MANKQVSRPAELSLIPPSQFFMVIDMNTNAVSGPFNTQDEAKYKAAEVMVSSRGPKPVGVFQYVGGVSRQQEPIYWNEPSGS